MKSYYFTFGSNCELKNNYFVIQAKSHDIARNVMFNLCGPYFCTSYEGDIFIGDEHAKKYNLTECTTQDVIKHVKEQLYQEHIVAKYPIPQNLNTQEV